MKRSISIILAIVLLLSLASCTFLDDLLSVNLFEETFELSAADVANSSVGALLAQSDSDAFFKTVGDDTAIRDAILGMADAVIATSSDQKTVQEAGILGASVIINTSPAGDLLANAAGLADADPAGISTMEELLDLVLPDSVYVGGVLDQTAFSEMIKAFEDANEYYTAIGNNLGEDYLTTNASAGDIAVGAFIAAALDGLDLSATGYTDVGLYLYDLITDTDESVVAVPFSSPLDDTSGTYVYLDNILAAANLGSLLNL